MLSMKHAQMGYACTVLYVVLIYVLLVSQVTAREAYLLLQG